VTDDEIIDASARIRSALFRLLAAQSRGSDACAHEIMKVAPELVGLPLELVLVEALSLFEAALFVCESPFSDAVATRVEMPRLLDAESVP
jgi:hypothetical protein